MKKTILAAAAALLSTSALSMADEGMKRPGPDGTRAKMMQAMDSDGDRRIQAGEFMAFSAEKAKKRFEALDTDGDGAVTEAEFSAAAVARSAAMFSRMDRNSDGSIGKDDAKRFKKGEVKESRSRHFKRHKDDKDRLGRGRSPD